MQLPKTYDPSKYEEEIYDLWEKAGAFKPVNRGADQTFSIVLPPPNATGKLHVGHAAMLAIEDTIVRYQRMLGKETLWIPGTDHAAIATENYVIEALRKEKGMDDPRAEMGREKIVEAIKRFVANSQDSIRSQIRAMGASVDWENERYTMEPGMQRVVGEVFIKMHKDGLIYRGERIVNWDPNLQTTVADDELEYEEETGKLYTLKYGPFKIATARPETKFGDKYVVMHPDDNRYAKYKHGQTFEAEWINGKVTATIIKDQAIDPEFGTGVMTITPWHDTTDFEIAQRHELDKEQIIDFDGNLLPIAGEFEGLPIDEARDEIVYKLDKKGLLLDTDEKYKHNVSVNYRGKGVIEPQIKPQWFIDVNKPAVEWKGTKKSFKEVMQMVINDGDIKILPKRFEKTYFNWIDNLRDWNISRQIWWGHQPPAWFKKHKSTEVHVGWEPPKNAKKSEWLRDPDTLDTWFSSALWSWSTMIPAEVSENEDYDLEKMLKKAPLLHKFHPTDLMETGYDILFFWVARMILMTTYVTGEVPFKTVYLHGMVRTKDGSKMSKSKPKTTINPVEMIDKYGTDAMRLSLLVGQSPGADMRIYDQKVKSYRNFCNKLWNIARFVEGEVEGDFKLIANPKPITPADTWILTRLDETVTEVKKLLDGYELGRAYENLYHFIWNDFADWYIEVSKIHKNEEVLKYVLITVLEATHPFAPYVSETIWASLKMKGEGMLMMRPWPSVSFAKPKDSSDFTLVKNIIGEVRRLQTELHLNHTKLYFHGSTLISENIDLIKALSGVEGVIEVADGRGLQLTQTKENAWIDVEENVLRDHLMQLIKRRDPIKKQTVILAKRLKSKEYTKNAPRELVNESRLQFKEQQDLLKRLEIEIEGIEETIHKFITKSEPKEEDETDNDKDDDKESD